MANQNVQVLFLPIFHPGQTWLNVVAVAEAYWLINHCSAEYSLQYTYYMKLAASQVGR